MPMSLSQCLVNESLLLSALLAIFYLIVNINFNYVSLSALPYYFLLFEQFLI